MDYKTDFIQTRAQMRRAKAALDRIWKTQQYRSRQRLTEWKSALAEAESEIQPDRTMLQNMYRDMTNDLHLWSLMQTIMLKVLATGYYVEGADGQRDDDATDDLTARWFRRIIQWIIESRFYGFSLIQLYGAEPGRFIDPTLIPRVYVVPDAKAVKLFEATRIHKYHPVDPKEAISWEDPVYGPWLLPFGDIDDIGLLAKAAPSVILKKEMVAAWAEFGEVFGMPMRIMKSDIDAPGERGKMESMLENMGRSAWALLDPSDDLELVESNRTDAFKVYDSFIDRMNSEMSKGILGQTMTSDDGSSLSQAKVHSTVLDAYISAILQDVADIINDIFMPKAVLHGVVRADLKFKWDLEVQIPPQELIGIVKELANLSKIPVEWIQDTFNIPVEEKEDPIMTPLQQSQNVDGEDETLAKLRNIYAKAREHKCH